MYQNNDWILYQPIKARTLIRNLARQQVTYEKECRFLSEVIDVCRESPELRSALIDFFDSPDSFHSIISLYQINPN